MANSFTDAVSAIPKDSGLDAQEKLVLWVIAQHTDNKTGECYPSIPRIAHYACMGESTADKRVRSLLKRKLITITGKRPTSRGKLVNKYKVELEAIQALCHPYCGSQGEVEDVLPPLLEVPDGPEELWHLYCRSVGTSIGGSNSSYNSSLTKDHPTIAIETDRQSSTGKQSQNQNPSSSSPVKPSLVLPDEPVETPPTPADPPLPWPVEPWPEDLVDFAFDFNNPDHNDPVAALVDYAYRRISRPENPHFEASKLHKNWKQYWYDDMGFFYKLSSVREVVRMLNLRTKPENLKEYPLVSTRGLVQSWEKLYAMFKIKTWEEEREAEPKFPTPLDRVEAFQKHCEERLVGDYDPKVLYPFQTKSETILEDVVDVLD